MAQILQFCPGCDHRQRRPPTSQRDELSDPTEDHSYVTRHDLPPLVLFGAEYQLISDEDLAGLDGASAASVLFDIGIPAEERT